MKSGRSITRAPSVMRTGGRKPDHLISELRKAIEAARALQRLPKTTVPYQYTICIKPFIEDDTFEGSVSITISIMTNAKQLVLHSLDLVITKVMWEEDVTENRQEPVEVQLDRDKGILKLIFDPFLIPSKGSLRINFKGRISEKKLNGMYRCKTNAANATEGGGENYSLVTYFDPADARRLFPCFDEPEIKATFDIFLIIQKNKTALSNMAEKVSYPHKKNPDLKIVEFKRSPLMSTFLTGFVVGDFDYIEGISKDDVVCRVYTPPGLKEEGQFALDLTLKMLPYFKSYFNVAYPLSKLDLVAVSELPTNVQDNWGMLMMRELDLLVNSGTAATDKQKMALVIAEGISSLWFGSLTTHAWWNDVFLTEGFSTFAKYIGVDYIFPEFDIWSQFVGDIHLKSMRLDSLKLSHPMHMEVGNPQDLESIFDDIEFKKGASLIRMLHRYMGDEDFRKGVRKYLLKFQYASATAEDFWRALEEASGKPIMSLMSSWTKQMGFPLIKVASKQEGKNRVLKFTQERFVGDIVASKGSKMDKKDLWMIPITISTAHRPNKVVKELLMDGKSLTITLVDVEKLWIKLNPGVVGYYRVRYPQDMLAQFIPAIRAKTISPLDRLGLLDDVFALVQSGHALTVEALSLAEAFCEEDEYVVWVVMGQMFDKLLTVFGNVDYLGSLKTFGKYIYTYIYEKLGWEAKPSEGHTQIMMRSLVLRSMMKFDDEKVIKRALDMFDRKIKRGVDIPVDLCYVAYSAAVLKAADETMKLMSKMHRESESQEEKDRLANAMGSVNNSKHAKFVLDFAMTDDVRRRDSVTLINAIARNKIGREIAWSYFKDNFGSIKSRFTTVYLIKLIRGIGEGFASEEKASEFSEFFRMNPLPGCDRACAQTVEWIRINDAWLKREMVNTMMKDFLESF